MDLSKEASVLRKLQLKKFYFKSRKEANTEIPVLGRLREDDQLRGKTKQVHIHPGCKKIVSKNKTRKFYCKRTSATVFLKSRTQVLRQVDLKYSLGSIGTKTYLYM